MIEIDRVAKFMVPLQLQKQYNGEVNIYIFLSMDVFLSANH